MRSILFLAAFVVAANLAFAEILVNPDLGKVKVYRAGAELTSTATVNLRKGLNEVVFDSLPMHIDNASIRAAATKGIFIISVTDKIEEFVPKEDPPIIAELVDSIEALTYESNLIRDESATLKEEEDRIRGFTLNPSQGTVYSIDDLQKLAEYHRNRVGRIRKTRLGLEREKKTIDEGIALLNARLAAIRATHRPSAVKRIVITVNAESSGTGDVSLTYFSSNAGWLPRYDIKAKDASSPLELIYKADVWQNTGKDWNDVELILSTRDPNESNNLPSLNPWYLRLNITRYSGYAAEAAPLSPSGRTRRDKRESTDESVEIDGLNVFQANPSTMFVEYVPTLKYTIPSDKKSHMVSINSREVPATFEHYTVPKMDPAAYLVAKIADWGKYNLLAGEANIYFEDAYIAKTTINPNAALDTLKVSLGKDNNVLIERKEIEDYTEDRFLSKNKVKTYGYRITVRNNRPSEITINVRDQIPVSTHEDIKVESINLSGGTLEKTTGFVDWKFDVKPNKSVSKDLVFKVDMP